MLHGLAEEMDDGGVGFLDARGGGGGNGEEQVDELSEAASGMAGEPDGVHLHLTG